MTSENTPAPEGTRSTSSASTTRSTADDSTGTAAAPLTRRAIAASRRRASRRRLVGVTAVAAVAIVAGTGFAFVNRAPSAEAVAAAHAQSVKQNEEAIADSLAEAQAKSTIDIASQVVTSTKDKVDASALETSVASLADYENLDSDTLAARVAETATTAQTVQAAASEADRQAAAAAAAAQAAANTPAAAKAAAQQLASSKYGWGSDQYGCLVNLWQKESGWNYKAYNPSGATGIPQALPGSKMATAGSDWATNATTQVAWGLDYIDRAYGTPCSAWGHSQSVNWY